MNPRMTISRAEPRASFLGRVALAALLLSGCQQILGLDKIEPGITKDRDAGTGTDAGGGDAEVVYETPSDTDCKEYCDLVNETCAPSGPKAAYANTTYCPGLCAEMQKIADGTPSEKTNTFDCRLAQVQDAVNVAPDNSKECRTAGAGGEDACGSSCEGYCQLFEGVCGSLPGLSRGATCVSECQKLAVDKSRNAAMAFGSESDTLECRLAHLGAAAFGKAENNAMLRENHCKHAALSVTTEYTPCVRAVPKCEDFCTLAQNTCTGAIQQYETHADCVAMCSRGMTLSVPLEANEPIDIIRDTVACRRYHVYNAIKSPTGVHCEHGGPTGDGHCGDHKICTSFCRLAKAACDKDYATKYGNGDAADKACDAECDAALKAEGVPDQYDHHYSVPKGKAADADPMQCRVYKLSKAFLAPQNCAAALGETDDCR